MCPHYKMFPEIAVMDNLSLKLIVTNYSLMVIYDSNSKIFTIRVLLVESSFALGNITFIEFCRTTERFEICSPDCIQKTAFKCYLLCLEFLLLNCSEPLI